MVDTTVPHPATGLEMTLAEYEAILAHLRAALPNEGVALLATQPGDVDLGQRRVTRIYPGTNTRASPTRFEMDQREILHALRDIDERGWSLGAIVHSHPRGPATLSVTDLAEAFYPEALLVIASFATGSPVVRAWRLDNVQGKWTPVAVPLTIAGAGQR